MKKALAELVGTFLLVFIGTGSVIYNDLITRIGTLGIAIAFGLAVALGVKLFGSVSGAHMNPAVSISFYMNKQLNQRELIAFLLVQCIGAILASFSLKLLFPLHLTYGTTFPTIGITNTFLLEILLTFLLMITIYLVKGSRYEKYTGYAAAFIVFLEAFFAGPLTGASMNPARSLGPALISGEIHSLLIYLIAPIIGAVLALKLCPFLSRKESCCSSGAC